MSERSSSMPATRPFLLCHLIFKASLQSLPHAYFMGGHGRLGGWNAPASTAPHSGFETIPPWACVLRPRAGGRGEAVPAAAAAHSCCCRTGPPCPASGSRASAVAAVAPTSVSSPLAGRTTTEREWLGPPSALSPRGPSEGPVCAQT